MRLNFLPIELFYKEFAYENGFNLCALYAA
ncbi:MAG: hypothetical protein BWX85_01235 [Chloroflexi bacterium ADurb.Bin120]|jgi:hypothetical protein|nr:MAG: hypothetical protein BWX85_01235 [Chloroflexi bacterium ADurb.Bin120]